MTQKLFVPVVGVGASAGGVEALTNLFARLPAETNAAYVIAIHMMPESESMLHTIINRHSGIPAQQATDGQPLEAGTITVVPPGYDVSLSARRLHLRQRDKTTEDGVHLIDDLLKNLAAEYGERAIAVILSGTGTDGVAGAQRVRAVGGFVLAESAETAAHPGLPQAVFETGAADDRLPLPALAERLVGYLDRFDGMKEGDADEAYIDEKSTAKILAAIREITTYDFSSYKPKTMRRQLTRRLALDRVDSPDAYIDTLWEEPEKAHELVRYLLIRVTRFFRDPAAFEALKEKAIHPLLDEIDPAEPLRVWVAGCSTGQEVYSIAILIDEALRERDLDTHMAYQMFGSDVNPELLVQARAGLYPHSIEDEISEDRLERYFIRTDEGYKVSQRLASKIVWARHNLLSDPPFSKLHLMSCRNVMIYLKPEVQNKLMALAEYALKPGGYLFLGTAETVRAALDGLKAVDHANRIYQSTTQNARQWLYMEFPLASRGYQPDPSEEDDAGDPLPTEQTIVERAFLNQHPFAALIVDEYDRVTYTYGHIDNYLKVVPGRAEWNLFEMVREGLEADLTTALFKVRSEGKTVERKGVWVRTNGDEQIVDLTVLPLRKPALGGDHMLVLIEPVTVIPDGESAQPTEDDTSDGVTVKRLQRELGETKSALSSATQALQAKNEELSSSLEEIRSASEEAQTTNEELVTSKEELESMNTELNILNEQLTDRNTDLQQVNNDLHNLLNTIQLAVIFLDLDMNIRTFTPAATELFNLIDADKGRPLGDIVSQLAFDTLAEDAAHVLDTLNTVSKEVQTKDGRWYHMRILPYRTVNNVIDGLVLTFNDITEQITYQQRLEELNAALDAEQTYTQSIIDTMWAALLVLNGDLRIVSANKSFYDMLDADPDAIEGVKLYELDGEHWQSDTLRRLLEEIIPQEKVVYDYTFQLTQARNDDRPITLNARQLRYQNEERILLVMRFIEEPPHDE
jgi:two-component system CheB/CheR fusion protein